MMDFSRILLNEALIPLELQSCKSLGLIDSSYLG